MDKCSSPGLTAIADASEFIFNSVTAVADSESIPLLQASGRVLAEDCISGIDVPPQANSAMDGYAVRAADLARVPVSLPVAQRITAGQSGDTLVAGTVARIFTGASLPAGADAVVMQEDCEAEGDKVRILQQVQPGENVRAAGEDIRSGTCLFTRGHRLRPQDVGVLAAIGLTSVNLSRRLRVAIFTTGDELVEPGQPLKSGQIYNSNRYSIEALLQNLQVDVFNLGVVQDDFEATRSALLQAAEKVDCIISTGGVSVGEADFVKAAVEAEGELRLWKLAIKPGKPLAYGRVGECHFFGLPGNPVSAFVTFLLLVRPSLLKLAGCDQIAAHQFPLPAQFEAAASGMRQEYIRVRLDYSSGSPRLQPYDNQSSGVGSSLSSADGLAIIPPHTAVALGDTLQFIPFSELLI